MPRPARKYKSLFQLHRQIIVTTAYREEAARRGRWPSAKPHQGPKECARRVRQAAERERKVLDAWRPAP